MKLLIVTAYYKPAYVYGGPVRSTATFYEGLAQLGVDVTVITTDANGKDRLDVPLLKPLEVDGVQVIYCPTKPLLGSRFYSPTQIEVAKQYIQHADIINLQTFWGYATRPLSQLCMKHQIPYFVSLRGQLMDYAMKHTNWRKQLKKHIFLHLVGYHYLNGAAALHCTSSQEIADLQTYPINTPAFLVPNGIDVTGFDQLPVRGQFRTLLGIPKGALVMLMVGRIHPKKRPDIAIAALAAAQQLDSEVHLLIVGPDESNMQPSLIELARRLRCADKLHFTGLLQGDSLLQTMADADLLIMPSEPRSENFGMSAAEAMAAGLPILITHDIPVGTWAVKALAGKAVSCDEDSFCKETVTMLNNPDQLHDMGRRGKAAAAKFFDQKSVAKTMMAHLERIIGEAKSHHA